MASWAAAVLECTRGRSDMTLICRRLDADGDITGGYGMADFLTGDEATVQTIRCELRFQLGEWFLDATKGVPWVRNSNTGEKPILGPMPADLPYAEAMVKAAIMRVDGVHSLTSFTISFNHTTRAATCTVKGRLDTGATFTISEGII